MTQSLVLKPNDLKDKLDSPEFQKNLSDALSGVNLTPAKFARIAWNTCTKNPALFACSTQSLFRCILECAAAGLEPDGRRAHLIPRQSKDQGMVCTWQADYKGIKELLFRNHDVLTEHSDVVCEADHFEYEYGTNQHLWHKPPRTGERGAVILAYSWVRLPDQSEKFEVMYLRELEAIRERSATPDKGPWKTDTNEMYKKTVFKRLAKGLPLSPRTREVVDQDDEEFEPKLMPQRATVFTPGASPLFDQIEENIQQGVLDVEPPNLLKELESKLKQSGFKVYQLTNVLYHNKLIKTQGASLKGLSNHVIQTILDDWDNCLAQMEQENRKPEPPESKPSEPEPML